MLNIDTGVRIRNRAELTAGKVGGGAKDPGHGSKSEDVAATHHGRVLIVEDEFLLSSLLESDFTAAGFDVAGPHASLSSALSAARREPVDIAVLDVNLKGELVYPVAEELHRRNIPFLFVTGYSTTNMPMDFRAYPRLAKPAPSAIIISTVHGMLKSRKS